MRFFNTAGPVNRKNHYCLSPLNRFDLEEILSLINQEKYFVMKWLSSYHVFSTSTVLIETTLRLSRACL